FERIIDPGNVLHITQAPASAEEKQRQITMILSTVGEIRAAYAYAVMVGEPLQEELTRIRAFTLLLLDAAVRLSGDTVDAQRQTAWRTTFFGIVDSLSERKTYSNTQIAALSAALAVHYPVICRIFPNIDRRDFRDFIAKLSAAEDHPGQVHGRRTRSLSPARVGGSAGWNEELRVDRGGP